MTTEKSTHATQHEYKRYENPARFRLFYTKGEGCFGRPGPRRLLRGGTLLFLLLFFLFSTCVFILRVNRVCVIVLVTPEDAGKTVGTGLMHVNECKQVSDSQINQKIYLILLTVTPPPPPPHHALHNSLEFSYITYMLHSLISYVTDIKANISMQSGSCSAFSLHLN